MSRIFWDTNLSFIYLVEEFGDLSERVIKLRKRMIERGKLRGWESFPASMPGPTAKIVRL